ncbi:hypothetical protein F0562_005045 [Nyssa sinensis]|uniref:Pyrrolo-quinoline quinone repeat domain-containing protein n=1 Tax=Nyssa sinensis TaxID=561372 RepID=A0A5J5AL41_9ASTE|nr:hypothetical protein F0562_005045 [Nyssa sinensis]
MLHLPWQPCQIKCSIWCHLSGKSSCCLTIMAKLVNMLEQLYGEAALPLMFIGTLSLLPLETYTQAPLRIRQCQEIENNQTVPTHPDQCVEPDNHSESFLAFDLDSGKIKWYRQLGGYDVWFLACNNLSTPNCPPGPNPDADFGEAPMMLSIYENGTKRDIVAAVQKSGFAWALDRDNGSIIWSTEAGPGGNQGGGTWGAATDGKRIYTNIVNNNHQNFTLNPSNENTTSGGWVAMNATTGKILWSTANPSNATSNGPVTVANGVLFAGSTNGEGPIYAMNAESGKIMWSYNTGATVFGGMSVSKGCIFVGNGYARHVKRQYSTSGDWLNHGGDIYNRRYAYGETNISPSTVSQLRLKWKFYAGRDITATPAIFNGTLYFPSWNGYLFAVKAVDGSLVWKKNLQKLTGLNSTGYTLNVSTTVSRATPTVAGDLLVIGINGPAVIIAVKRATGKLMWSTRLDSHPATIITMSGTFHKGGFYVGTSSLEEGFSIKQCCTFRGSLAKLDVQTGHIIWQTFMLPDNHGKIGAYAGAAIWGSSPSIDVNRNLVYIATGNLYSAPLRVQQCQEKENNQTVPTHPDKCIEPDNHSESILALDLDSGKIAWYKQLGGYDVWFFACNNLSTPNCPPGPNPDADFGEAPMMLSILVNGTKRDIVVAVQKSGFAWALDRDSGNLVWRLDLVVFLEEVPGEQPQIKRGSYTNIANDEGKNFTLKPSKKITTAGGWVGMDARTGKILWSTANPSNATSNAPVTVSNGVLFAGSAYQTGPVYAMNAKTGKILWSHDTGATIYGGISVSKGCIYLGNGYKEGLGVTFPSFTFRNLTLRLLCPVNFLKVISYE